MTAIAAATPQPAVAPALPDEGLTYVGTVLAGHCSVTIVPGRADLPPRRDLRNHSPDGFSWGHSGSGPARLALALVAHATGDDRLALRVYQAFKESWVAMQAKDRGWHITAAYVRQFAHTIETARQAHA